jgi:hypothetical protein
MNESWLKCFCPIFVYMNIVYMNIVYRNIVYRKICLDVCVSFWVFVCVQRGIFMYTKTIQIDDVEHAYERTVMQPKPQPQTLI